MSESDDEFMSIYEMNNVDEILSHAAIEKLQVKDLQEGLAALSHVCCFLSEFILDTFTACVEDREEDAPKIGSEMAFRLVEVMKAGHSFLEAVDEEFEDYEEEDDGD